MHALKTLTPAAEEKLQNAGDWNIYLEVKKDIEAGRSQLFECPDDTYIVLMIDGTEMIFVAVLGKNGIKLMAEVLQIARNMRLKTLRFHTKKKGIARMARRFKPEFVGVDSDYGNTYRITV